MLNQRRYTGSNNSIPGGDKKSVTPNSELKIPLYSNVDYRPFVHDHEILALQQYMVEQAKSLGSNSSYNKIKIISMRFSVVVLVD